MNTANSGQTSCGLVFQFLRCFCRVAIIRRRFSFLQRLDQSTLSVRHHDFTIIMHQPQSMTPKALDARVHWRQCTLTCPACVCARRELYHGVRCTGGSAPGGVREATAELLSAHCGLDCPTKIPTYLPLRARLSSLRMSHQRNPFAPILHSTHHTLYTHDEFDGASSLCCIGPKKERREGGAERGVWVREISAHGVCELIHHA